MRQWAEGLEACVRFTQTGWESHVIYHADNFLPVRIVAGSAETFANRAFIREVTARQRFVDDDDLCFVGQVIGVEETTCQQPYAVRLEITCIDRLKVDFGPLTGLRFRLAFDFEAATAVKPESRLRVGQRDVLHARQRAQTFFELLIEG